MPRPRTATNADIVEGTLRAIGRLGPTRLTLADVATDVGLAPATLVQRFGSKRALLLAVVEHSVASVDSCFETARGANASPVDALLAAATNAARDVESPESLANHLAFVQMDMSDPAFHRAALEHSQRVGAGYRALIGEAVSAGQLTPCNADQLARAIQAVTGGSLISWTVHREGRVLDWVRQDVETLLEPYRLRRASISAAAPLHPPTSEPRPTGPRARHTTGGGRAVSPSNSIRRSGV